MRKSAIFRVALGTTVSVCRPPTAHTPSVVFHGVGLWILWILACGIFTSGCIASTDQAEVDKILSFDISPDDKQIVFVYRNAGERRLYKASIDGSHVERLDSADGPEPGGSPVFSPDGKQILIREPYKRGTRQIVGRLHLMDIHDDSFRPLTFGVLGDGKIMGAAFAHDGKTIYFFRKTGHSGLGFAPPSFGPPDTNLYSMDLASSRIQQLTHYKANYLSGLAASKDGQYLFFLFLKVKASLKHEQFVVLYYLQESSRFLFIPIERDVINAALSPDNQYVVFSTWDDLFRMDIQTQETSRLTSLNIGVSQPKFLHAQSKILFLADTPWPCGTGYDSFCHSQLMEMDVDGSNLRTINIAVP